MRAAASRAIWGCPLSFSPVSEREKMDVLRGAAVTWFTGLSDFPGPECVLSLSLSLGTGFALYSSPSILSFIYSPSLSSSLISFLGPPFALLAGYRIYILFFSSRYYIYAHDTRLMWCASAPRALASLSAYWLITDSLVDYPMLFYFLTRGNVKFNLSSGPRWFLYFSRPRVSFVSTLFSASWLISSLPIAPSYHLTSSRLFVLFSRQREFSESLALLCFPARRRPVMNFNSVRGHYFSIVMMRKVRFSLVKCYLRWELGKWSENKHKPECLGKCLR